jgi:hypothetical protein
MIEGTPILKLTMVTRLKVKKIIRENQNLKKKIITKIVTKIGHKKLVTKNWSQKLVTNVTKIGHKNPEKMRHTNSLQKIVTKICHKRHKNSSQKSQKICQKCHKNSS